MTRSRRSAPARRYYLPILAAAFLALWLALLAATGPGVWTLRPVETIRARGVVYVAPVPGELVPAGAEPITLEAELTPNPYLRPITDEPGHWLTNRPLAGEAEIEQAGVRARAHLGASQLVAVVNLGYWVLLPFVGVLFLLGTYWASVPEEARRPLAVARAGFAVLVLLSLLPGLPGLLWALTRFTRGLPTP